VLEDIRLPAGVALVRTTREFTAHSVPEGLLSAHRVADGVWGRLCVHEGEVAFVLEETGASRSVTAGESQVIEPGVLHHVDPSEEARFTVEFHRRGVQGPSSQSSR
jgi:tellurite resistance-related uncharacterized protein